MKVLVLFVCVIVAVFAAEDIPPEARQRLKQVHEACEADPKTFADENLLRKLWDNKNNKQVQIHMKCMAERDDLLRPDGTFNEGIVKSRIGYLIKGEDNINKIYKKCTTRKGSVEETATYFWLCLGEEKTEYYYKL